MNPALMLLMSGRASLALAYTDYDISEVDGTAYTFSAVSLGTASAGRRIIVGFYARFFTFGKALSSLTIGGVTATVTTQSSTNFVAGFAIAHVPTGATGDVVATFNAEAARCGIVVWAVDDAVSVIDSDYTTGTTGALSVTLSSGAFALAFHSTTSTEAAGSVTWTGATERFDAFASPLGLSGADTPGGGGVTITSDSSTPTSVQESLHALVISRS